MSMLLRRRHATKPQAVTVDSPPVDTQDVDVPNIARMNKAALLEFAANNGFAEVSDAMTKAEIVAAIEGPQG